MDEVKDGTREPRSFTQRQTWETSTVFWHKHTLVSSSNHDAKWWKVKMLVRTALFLPAWKQSHTKSIFTLKSPRNITTKCINIYACQPRFAACKRWMCRRAPLFTPSRPHLQQLISKDEMWVFVSKLFWVCTRAVAMATAGKKQRRRAMREVVRWWWWWWGVEAIIGEGWRGHVLCTLSLLSCSGNIVGCLPGFFVQQPFRHSWDYMNVLEIRNVRRGHLDFLFYLGGLDFHWCNLLLYYPYSNSNHPS